MAQLSYPQRDHSLREAAIAFAVDVSYSTAGPALAAEQRLISRVAKRLSPKSQLASSILPWSGCSYPVLGLNRVDTLQPCSSTRPMAILEDAQHLAALSRSSLWFFLTDGIIGEQERVTFANKIPSTGIHGTACITVVVQSQSALSRPAHCNISVGVSMYAMSPNCLFLFCDEQSNKLFILQAKGAFKTLLKGAPAPSINESTTWDSLPRLSADELCSVTIPVPQTLDAQQIALQDSLVINVRDLVGNKLPQATVDQILANEDNLSSVIMTLLSRNQQDVFQSWLSRQASVVDDPLYRKRTDIDGRAASIYAELVDSMNNGAPPRRVQDIQQSLREAHARNMRGFLTGTQADIRESHRRHATIQMASKRSCSSRIDRGAALSATSSYASDGNDDYDLYRSSNGRVHRLDHASAQTAPERRAPRGSMAAETAPRYYTPFTETWMSWKDVGSDPNLLSLLYTPGFRNQSDAFTGTCPMCSGRDRIMAWLFHDVAVAVQLRGTPEFPVPGGYAPLAFPLAMGFFEETDILSPALCCETCAVFAVLEQKVAGDSEPIVAALPMVRYGDNATSYGKMLQQLFKGRFADEDTAQVFMSALHNAAAHLDDPDPESLFRRACRWTLDDLMRSSEIPTQLSGMAADPNDFQMSYPMHDVLSQSFMDESTSPYLTKYLIHGFMVLMEMADLLNVSLESKQQALFRRFLYVLTEELFAMNAEEETVKSMDNQTARTSDSWKQINNILWNYESVTETTLHQKPKLSISFESLRGTVLLPETTYSLFKTNKDAKFLQSSESSWVGFATAIYLHEMMRAVGQTNPSEAWDVFIGIMSTDTMRGVLASPKDLDAVDAERIISSIV